MSQLKQEVLNNVAGNEILQWRRHMSISVDLYNQQRTRMGYLYVWLYMWLDTSQITYLATCVVWMIVRSFMRDMPAPMAALRPAVPNSILEEKHFFRASTAPSFTRSCTSDTVLGFWIWKEKTDRESLASFAGSSLVPPNGVWFRVVWVPCFERECSNTSKLTSWTGFSVLVKQSGDYQNDILPVWHSWKWSGWPTLDHYYMISVHCPQ